MYRGWTNIITPFCGTIVLCTLGSDKFSYHCPVHRQYSAKGRNWDDFNAIDKDGNVVLDFVDENGNDVSLTRTVCLLT